MTVETAQALARANNSMRRSEMKIIVGIPSAGRRDIVAAVLPHLSQQIRQPDEIIICVPTADDVDATALPRLPCPVRVLVSQRGSCRQRNAILDAAPDADIVLFLDDDFLLSPNYLSEMEHLFLKNPDVDISTGTVIADGITGPGIAVTKGLELLRSTPEPNDETPISTTYNGYGCNLAVRMSAVHIGGLRFDENLPLYGWLEDVDFSRVAARYGRVVTSPRLIGVHLGTKVGRTSSLRFGYSQIANPIYLMRKETMSLRHATTQMGRNLLANLFKVWRPEPWIDRKGRLSGNLLGLRHLVTGQLAPRNIENMD
ncbi:glycosyltransferase [Rhizobium sp. CECT 9324]|uniref:glycosyltransferase family 2 protein n=1 Tax=Rhizobium sp. CECT 9324 TaxID=2845820 RepID=UPI001E4E6AD7|nr:glycosyltransferase [Rhizobium sp. CECT 9324]CAH0342895.1 hypothetical protein RHI9324_04627 [Rhizobium sp. CECT 9324]